MAAAAELPQPGVEVIQQLRTVTPVIVAPTLAPCIMGVCKQILEVLEDDGTVNADALATGPAVATAPNAQASYDIDTETLIVSIGGGPNQTFTFSGSDPLTATVAAANINAAAIAPVGFAAYAYNDGSNNYLQLRTTTSGSGASIKIIGGTALVDLGWDSNVGYTYFGIGTYTNRNEFIPQTSLPDPRGIMDEIDVEEATIRCFVDVGSEVREFLDTESFLRNGTTVITVDDADGDATTPLFLLESGGENLLGAATAAVHTGNVDLTVAKAIHGQTLIMGIDGGAKQTLTLVGQPIVSIISTTPWDYVADLQSKDIVFTVNGTTVTCTFSAGVADIDGVVSEINAAAVAVLGAGTIIAYRCDEFGDVNAAGDYMGMFYGGAPPTIVANTSIIVEDSAGGSTAATVTDLFGSDTHFYQNNTGDKADPSQPIDDIEAQIDTLWGGNVAAIDGSDFLVLTSATVGVESKIDIDSNSTSLTNLGLTAAVYNGVAFPIRSGDAFYADGSYIGDVLEVHPGAVMGRIRVSSEVAITSTYSTWYIISKNLNTLDRATEWGIIAPTADFWVDTQGDIRVKHDILRDTAGDPVATATVNMYFAYTALRLDVSPDAEEPALLAFDDVDDLDDALGPLTPANPLGYGLSLALQNAGAVRVYGIGVGDDAADMPYGTVTAWQEAYDFLEAQGVYALAPMTDDLESVLLGRTHVLAMSQPEEKGERILICYLGRPARKADTIVGSGTDGDKLSATTFDTKISNLSQLLLAAGVDPGSIAVGDDVFLDIATDSKNYNVTGINGSVVTINTTFTSVQNTDGFYSLADLTTLTLISETFSVKVRGAAIASTSAGKSDEITTIIARGSSFGSRRVWMQQLDQARATVESVDSLIPGFFVCAAKAGMVAGNPPSMPFTNFPMTGFTGFTGSHEIYTTRQLNQGAGGGADWVVQTAEGVPLVSRHQVTTDLTSVETTEQSITKALDYVSIFMRIGLRNFIGRYNITDTFLDTLASVVQGQLQWLMDHKIIAQGEVNNIIQDADNPTRVLIDCTVQPYYPCNYIRLTLVV